MYKHLLHLIVFIAGLAVVCWIGAGYIGTHPLGAVVAALIGACYVAGGFELYRYRQATATLTGAVAEVSAAPPGDLAVWLGRLPAGLRHAVRLRVEGTRAALPGPALTPYLVGLLVLLGMLGTLLGMMVTLRGTGLALAGATDLASIRGALAAPVKGLGFAFGTSIAGVASSAMLGLLSALCRRERQRAVQALDACAATSLRIFSQAYQRDQAFRLLEQQTAAMPALLDRLQAMMAGIEQHSAAADERQLANQARFHAGTEAAYTRLADAVAQSLKNSAAESARAVGAALQPAMEATMAGLARETASMQASVTQAVQRQLEHLSAGLDAAGQRVADLCNDALAQRRQVDEALSGAMNDALQRFTDTAGQRSARLLDTVSERLQAATEHTAGAWKEALAQQQAANENLGEHQRQALGAAAAAFEAQAASLVGVVQRSHEDLQAALEARDGERLETWTSTFESMVTTLNRHWEQAGERSAQRQQAVCDALERSAREISTQAQAQASQTIAEISRLVEAASDAPRAAAEVVAELREKLSESMVRDTAMLEERSRLLATLQTLLDAVNHASTEQRAAVDALVSTSAELLDRVGSRFTDRVQAQAGKLDAAAAQVTGSVVEMASLGEAFTAAVQSFGQSNAALMEHLQHIASALDASLQRSDEQLAYYVAQAKEVIDLSMLSQRQIVEDLQQLGVQRASAAGGAA